MSEVEHVRVGNALDLERYPIAPATRCRTRIETAGVIPIDPQTGEIVVGDIAEQSRLTLDNLTAILAAAGAKITDVMFVDIILADPDRDFAGFNAVYTDWIGDHRPARRTFGARLALPDLLIEVRAVADVSS